MDTQPPWPGEKESKSSRLAGATSNEAVIGTQPERRQQLVYRDAANVATKCMTQDAHLNIVCETGSSKNIKRHAVGCEYICIQVNSSQLTIWRTVGVFRELRDQCIAASNGKPLWSTKAFGCTVHEIEHLDVVSSGILADGFPDKHPREWTQRAFITLE